MKKSKIIEVQKRVIIAMSNELTESKKRQINREDLSKIQHEHIQMFTTLLEKVAEVVGLESDVDIHEGWVSLPSKIKMMQDKLSIYEAVIPVPYKGKDKSEIDVFINELKSSITHLNEQIERKNASIVKLGKSLNESSDTMRDLNSLIVEQLERISVLESFFEHGSSSDVGLAYQKEELERYKKENELFRNNERYAKNAENEEFTRDFYRRGEELNKKEWNGTISTYTRNTATGEMKLISREVVRQNKEKGELNGTMYDIKGHFEMADTEFFADLPKKNATESSLLDLWGKELDKKAANQWLGKH